MRYSSSGTGAGRYRRARRGPIDVDWTVVPTPSAQYSLTIRVEIDDLPGMLGRVAGAIGDAGGTIGAVDLVEVGERLVRDVTVDATDADHWDAILARDQRRRRRQGHRRDRPHVPDAHGRQDRAAQQAPAEDARRPVDGLHARRGARLRRDRRGSATRPSSTRSSATRSPSSATAPRCSGLGDIGPEAAMPVMEGKAMLFKEFAGVDAFPICLSTKDPDEIVETVTPHRARRSAASTSRTSRRRAASRSRTG